MTEHQLKFFASSPHSCGYLPEQTAVSLFADPNAPMNKQVYSLLIGYGFRRSGNHVYRPYCQDCQQCIPVRIPVSAFRARRSQKRCWQKNQDLEVRVVNSSTDEHFGLYQRYIQARHPGGSMDDPNPQRFREFIDSAWCETLIYEFRLAERLVAVAITDRLDDGLSAFYTYFDVELSRSRSLGNFSILWQIEQCRQLGLPWHYLGYWIEDCDKMNYKAQFKPLEGWIDNSWQTLS